MKPYIIKDDGEDYTVYNFALYVGDNLSDKYPDSKHFYLYVSHYNIWERHAFDKRVDKNLIKPDKSDSRDFVKHVFEALKWTISS